MPKLAGIFTRILLIIHVKPPEELFAYLLLLLFAVDGWGETDKYNEETHSKDFLEKKERNPTALQNFLASLVGIKLPLGRRIICAEVSCLVLGIGTFHLNYYRLLGRKEP